LIILIDGLGGAVDTNSEPKPATTSEDSLSWKCGWSSEMLSVALVLIVLPEGFFELVFEDDDAAGRLQRGALVADFSGAGGQPKLVAGVAAVAAAGALRVDQFRVAEPA
jgi:hypothetical protein